MDVREYSSAAAWLSDLSPLLLGAEAENNLLLGLAGVAAEQPQLFPHGVGLWAIANHSAPVGAVLMTRGHNLVLSRQPAEALTALSDWLATSSVTVPGVVGPDEVAERFAACWAAKTSVNGRLRMGQRIHACADVIWPRRAAGDFRAATENDVSLLADWWVAFAREVGSGPASDNPEARVRRIIAAGQLFVWTRGGEIVSCAGVTRPTAHGIAVYFVYTPPPQRGHGFATSCVAELTHRMLSAGRRFCCLYTDLANPISNAIYARLGYRAVCDSQWWEFAG